MIIIILIVSFFLIFWMQYPYVNKLKKKEESIYKYIYDISKIPLIVICLIILIYNINTCSSPKVNKIIDIDLSLPNF